MKPYDLPDFARLWQDQVDPAELAEMRALAKTIKRTAARRKLRDDAIGIAVFAVILAALLAGMVKLSPGFAIMAAPPAWGGWMRYRIAAAARALVVDEPRAFFAGAIANARAELRLSRILTWLAVPYVLLCLAVFYAAEGLASLELMRAEAFGQPLPKMIAFVVLIALLVAWALRATRDAREQLRRIERMSLEWDEQAARDRDEE